MGVLYGTESGPSRARLQLGANYSHGAGCGPCPPPWVLRWAGACRWLCPFPAPLSAAWGGGRGSAQSRPPPLPVEAPGGRAWSSRPPGFRKAWAAPGPWEGGLPVGTHRGLGPAPPVSPFLLSVSHSLTPQQVFPEPPVQRQGLGWGGGAGLRAEEWDGWSVSSAGPLPSPSSAPAAPGSAGAAPAGLRGGAK